jgi:hypothetical protein
LRSDSHIPPDKKCARHTASREGAAIAGANIPEPRRSMQMANYQFEGHQTRRSRNEQKKIFFLLPERKIFTIFIPYIIFINQHYLSHEAQ